MGREEELFHLLKMISKQYIGITVKEFAYPHPDGNVYKSKFQFYYDPKTGRIDVCHLGCNGTKFCGEEKDGIVSFSPPYGYPSSEEFVAEFIPLRDAFLKR
jgi:hypothetical protein